MDEVAKEHGILVQSVEDVPIIDVNGITFFGLKISFSGDNETVVRAILKLEENRPRLKVKSIVFHTIAGETGDQPVQIQVQVEIIGPVRIQEHL